MKKKFVFYVIQIISVICFYPFQVSAQADSTKTNQITINSFPPNADVFDSSGLIGKTPLFVPKIQIKSPIVLKKNGFNDLEIGDLSARSVFELKPVSLSDQNSYRIDKNNWFRSADDNKILIAVTGIVASGIVAAYFKLEASNNYRRYNETKDPLYSDKTSKYDTISAVGLGGVQVSLLYLTYLLLWE